MRTGAIEEVRLVPNVWAEGIAASGQQLTQLTYTEETAFTYQRKGLVPTGCYRYKGEGWGLATTGDGLVMSNGSAVLTFRSNEFRLVRTLEVRVCGKPLEGINDLECANGKIYLNVLGHHDIYEISTETGDVERIIDCTEIVRRSSRRRPNDVLNGVAYSSERDTFFVTGKHWPKMFELTW